MKKEIILMSLAASFLFAGCEDIYEGETPDYLKDMPVTFASKVVEYGSGEPETMATGVEAGLFMKRYQGTFSEEDIIAGVSNRRLVAGEDGALNIPETDEAIMYPKEVIKMDFVLYAPYQESIPGNAIAVDAKDDSAKNLLYSNNARGKYKSQSAMKVQFRHVPARLALTIRNGKGISEEDLKSVTATLAGTHPTGSLDLLTGSVSYTGNPAEIAAEISPDGKKGEIIVLPTAGTPPSKREIKFTVGAIEHSYIFEDDYSFEMGRQYNIDVEVAVSGLKVTIKEIEDWEVNEATGDSELVA